MTQKKPNAIRGRPSKVLTGAITTGVITLRVSQELHAKLAHAASVANKSLNKFILDQVLVGFMLEEIDNRLVEKS
jgi:predicted HicB family RNase H-like nuclease